MQPANDQLTCSRSSSCLRGILTASLKTLEPAPSWLDKNWPPLLSVFLHWLSNSTRLPFTLVWLQSSSLNIDSVPYWPEHHWPPGPVKPTMTTMLFLLLLWCKASVGKPTATWLSETMEGAVVLVGLFFLVGGVCAQTLMHVWDAMVSLSWGIPSPFGCSSAAVKESKMFLGAD